VSKGDGEPVSGTGIVFERQKQNLPVSTKRAGDKVFEFKAEATGFFKYLQFL
jgi:hypothetical protein